ncbi:flagellar basal-body MS-ring/collar protein FliF [Aminobacterium sp. MB27-C1]|jgi:flagellar M-ring protein FliF|uniref:flagellar basal-body MS-ring/collar protein FliF n=1 Tax=Aminobacterium sp. MB27-C1 TaxID=3070661 RepID=UPI001BCAEC2F|nr:flagellar basal-body MS-ring/collar protein FliF [Aminobacterium sp. MB27-C1]WMI71906.1 flagellar basal-body MS-ring/collar protein FliF [Aminobacterium sp. MB27-C1]
MNGLTQLKEKISAFWLSLRQWQRWSLVGAAVLVAAALVLLVLWGGKPSYEPLFAQLEVSDEAAIVSYLKENKIPYRIDPAAHAVLIPRDQVYEVRLTLAQEGLPKGGNVGLELFDDTKMGMNEFQQKVTFLRALEGELARTISQIEAIDYAKVNIVLPEKHLFLEQQQPSTASVLIRLKAGQEIGPSQIKAIIHLVSHSVEGLAPDYVTVVDTSGKVLSDMLDQELLVYSHGDGQTVSSVQRELERQQERELESKVRQMLERVYGPGHVVVRVKVELDFDKKQSRYKEYVPFASGKGVLRSQQNMEESFTGSGTPVGGAPGTTTNIPGYAIGAPNTGMNEYNKSDVVSNYEITTREGEKIDTPGGIRRLTASVLVDADLDETRLKELNAIVAPALGFRAERGDELAIQGMKFSTTLADSLKEQLQRERRTQLIFLLIGLAALLLLLSLGALWWVRRRKEGKEKKIAAGAEAGKAIPSIQDILSSPELLESQGELAILEEQLRAYAKSKPEEVANLLQEWISEDM